MNYNENVTVIIPCWNEYENLKECVSLLREHYKKIHIIVVNNGSIDKTQEWLDKQKLDNVYFEEGVQTVGRVLNIVLEKFNVNEYIFLIWPNVRVGKKTISSMIETLQKKNAGIVGCCANNEKYEQNIELQSYEDLVRIENTNVGKKDYEVIGCYGLCYGFAKSLVQKLGKFDENLAYTDVMVDYQLRSIKENYVNIISRNSYVYENVVSEDNTKWIQLLRQSDRRYLREKWQTNYFILSSNDKFNLLLCRDEEDEFNVLEVGCDMGANLLGIKNKYLNCKIYGLEINKSSAEIGKHIANIECGNIEDENVNFDVKFDYIILGDVLEHLYNPLKTIEYCKTLMNKNGRIIASIPNVMHISIIEQLLKGEFRYTDIGLLDKTHIHLFTQKEIVKMFMEAGYIIETLQGIIFEITEKQKELIQKLMDISEGITEDMYKVYQYTIVARVL